MAQSEPPLDTLDEPKIAAGDLRRVADMSYRQLNEWDKRASLPSQRTGEGGWRKVNAWQAMALRILSQLHRQYGIPLAKLQGLLRWMLGEAPTNFDRLRVLMAEFRLAGFSEEEKATPLRNGLYRIACTGEMLPLDAKPYAPMHLEIWVRANVQAVLPRLVLRGWETSAAESFANRFFSLSIREQFGVGCFSEIKKLLADSVKAGDASAQRAVEMVGSSLFPLLDAVGLMSSGSPVLLVTDLEDSYFVTEATYLEWVSQNVLPELSIVLRADQHINAVLATVGKSMPVTRRQAQGAREGALSVEERQVLDLLRSRNFDRVSIEPKGGGYHLEVQRNVSAQNAREITKILTEHSYQTVVIKTQDGRITRISQSVSMKVGAADKRKDPDPAPRKRKT
jgi:hypothetical protein